MPLHFVAHPEYTYDFPATHSFPMEKFAHLQEILRTDGTLSIGQLHQPQRIDSELLHLVHTPAWTAAVRDGTWDRQAARRVGLPWSPELAKRTFLAVGGTWLTVQLAVEDGLAGHFAGGTHHAFADFGAGYCLFNDLAVAAKAYLARYPNRQVAIIDCDVHQGDGTAQLLEDEPRAYTCSLHCGKNFPLRKQQSDLDIDLAKGTGDDEYLSILANTLRTVLDEAQPDLIIYDAGVDVHVDDRLGHLSLSDQGMRERDDLVISWAQRFGIPLAAVIGGGYDKDQRKLAARHAIVHHALASAAQR